MKRSKCVLLMETNREKCSTLHLSSAIASPRLGLCGGWSVRNLFQWLCWPTSIREAFLRPGRFHLWLSSQICLVVISLKFTFTDWPTACRWNLRWICSALESWCIIQSTLTQIWKIENSFSLSILLRVGLSLKMLSHYSFYLLQNLWRSSPLSMFSLLARLFTRGLSSKPSRSKERSCLKNLRTTWFQFTNISLLS